ncbi:hypothetical protein U1Q18_050565 [Sarracenia purpurea var. burkii]
MLDKLTDEHIYPAKLKKMKVSIAAQAFSQRVASTMKFAAGTQLPKEASDTAHFLHFFDKLFDSCNSSVLKEHGSRGKLLREAVSKNSGHHKVWNDSLPVLNSIKFKTNDCPTFSPKLVSYYKRNARPLENVIRRRYSKTVHTKSESRPDRKLVRKHKNARCSKYDESDGSLNSLKELLCTKSSSEKKFFHFEFSKDESFHPISYVFKLRLLSEVIL